MCICTHEIVHVTPLIGYSKEGEYEVMPSKVNGTRQANAFIFSSVTTEKNKRAHNEPKKREQMNAGE